MVKCSFCHNEIIPATGKMYVKKDGRVLYFCSSKCDKNMIKIQRNPRTTRWTAEFARVKKSGAEAAKVE